MNQTCLVRQNTLHPSVCTRLLAEQTEFLFTQNAGALFLFQQVMQEVGVVAKSGRFL